MNIVSPKVSLLFHTPEPEKICAQAARLCYSDSSIENIAEKLDKAGVTGFLKKIMSLGHYSVLEHATFTFGIEGISRANSHQLVRHRVASYSQQSQRYVKNSEDFPHILPESIKNCEKLSSDNRKAIDIFTEAIQSCGKAYQLLTEMDIPAEDARYLLPNATETKIIVTMNARELLHFFKVRCCDRAQWEIRDMSWQMLKLVKQIAPVIFEKAGPACVAGPCSEGSMSCGNPKK